ncbi:MAG: SIMPL domain-containing protein [Dehalococcoidia bacterium]|nr:SIMPL domain-containing protein [Dehalococcoidia bacterium]
MTLHNSARLLLTALCAATAALFLAACSDAQNGGGANGTSVPAETARAPYTGGAVSPVGIQVNGVGEVKLRADVAILALGVEGYAETVAEARATAANALADMLDALRSQGIADADIQTRHFSIQAEYDWVERLDARGSERVLTGYRVDNVVSVKVRDLDRAGAVIDAAAAAGGDAARINGVSFDVEDRTAAEAEARALALRDAIAKADQFATETGVTRGRLLHVAETSYTSPIFARAESFTSSSFDAPTPIIPGSLEVTATVQAVFAIE